MQCGEGPRPAWPIRSTPHPVEGQLRSPADPGDGWKLWLRGALREVGPGTCARWAPQVHPRRPGPVSFVLTPATHPQGPLGPPLHAVPQAASLSCCAPQPHGHWAACGVQGLCVGGVWLVVPRQEGLASGLGSISQRSLGLASRPFWAAPSLSAPSPPCGFVDTPRWAQATGRGGNKDHHGNAAITAPGMLPCWAPTPHRPQLLGATSTLCSCCPGGPGVGAWDHTRWAPTRTAPPCPLPLSLLTSTLWVVPT